MAVIQPFFQPDVSEETPMFAAFFNGFMMRRTQDNLAFMSHFLNNQDSKFLNSQITLIRKHKQELIKLRANIQAADRENGQKMMLEHLKGQYGNATARTNFGAAMLRAKGGVVERGVSTVGRGLTPQMKNLQFDRNNIFSYLNNPSAMGALMGKGHAGGAIQRFKTGARGLGDLLTYMIKNGNIDQNIATGAERQPNAIAATLSMALKSEITKHDADENYTGFFQTEKGKSMLTAAMGRVGVQGIGVDNWLKLQTLEGRFSKYTKDTTTTYPDVQKKLLKEASAEMLAFIHPQAEIYRLQQEKGRLKKDDTAKKLKITEQIEYLKRQIVRSGGGPSRKLRRLISDISPELLRTKKGKSIPDRTLGELNAEIKALDRDLLAKGISRHEVHLEIAKEGPARMFKAFKRNYLLESPFQRESSKSQRARQFMKYASGEFVRPKKKEPSKLWKNLEIGRSYSPRNTPELRIGIAKVGKEEKPFIIRDGYHKVVDKNEGVYDDLIRVLSNINQEYQR